MLSKDCQVVPCGQTNGHNEDNTVVTLAILYKHLEIVRQVAGIPRTKLRPSSQWKAQVPLVSSYLSNKLCDVTSQKNTALITHYN